MAPTSKPEGSICHLCGYRPPADAEDTSTCPQDGSYLIAEQLHQRFRLDPFLGRIIGGKYPVVGVLGAGGMGAVYEAIQQPVGRKVALKVIRDVAGRDEVTRKRFEQEAALVARLRHPNTVTLYDFGFHKDGTLYMVLELVEGHLLGQEIARGPLAPERAGHVVASVLDALVEAHTLGVAHRDLKPDNIMLSETAWGGEDVKVLDFGVAKIMGEQRQGDKGLTQTGVVFGTARYMAPEQVRRKTVDHRADLYAMGVILYECLTGKVPFDADNTFDILLAHIQQAPDVDPLAGVPEAVRDVLKQALAKRPEKRFQDAAAMAAAVRDAAGLPIHTPSSAAIGAARTPLPDAGPRDDTRTSQEMSAEIVATGGTAAGGRGWLLGAGAALAAAAVVGVGVWFGAGLRSRPVPEPSVSAAPAAPAEATATPAPAPTAEVPAPSEPPAPPPPQPMTGREAAERLHADGLTKLAAGERAAAVDALTSAAAADRSFAPAHLSLARALVGHGTVYQVTGALDAWLEARPEPAELARTLEGDDAFAPLARQPAFSDWLVQRGLKEAPPPKAKAKAKAKKRRGKRKKRARRKTRKKAAPAVEYPDL